MPPASSFIFVVILAVWAVYLVQHWVRRREHLATARSVDRFSEAMRVLERRRALPRPGVTEHTPRASSVLLRPGSPQVVVKRGVATAAGPTPDFRRAKQAARLRAVALGVSSVVMVALVVLSVTQVLPWWASFLGVLTLAATVAVIRWSVARDRLARRPGARPSGPSDRTGSTLIRSAPTLDGATGPLPRAKTPLARAAGAVVGRRASGAARIAPAARLTPAADAGAAPATGSTSPLAAQARAAAGHVLTPAAPAASRPARRAVDLEAAPPALYDIDAVETELARHTPEPAAATSEDPATHELPAGSWSPVPVPPPTYTLKAKAHRVVAGRGSAELPMDGTEMALDEEFEELPRIDRVG